VGRICGTQGEEEFIGFWLGRPRVRNQWENLGIGGKITLKWT
jgi:hypothetical protein